MPSEQNIFQPDQKLARAAFVSSFQQYEEMYKESIEQPDKFWGNIARQFHWETPADPSKFMSFNFDISKGPISIKWMEGASTNICYNLLDRNVKNGHGEKVAFLWYVLVFNISVWKCWKGLSRGWEETRKIQFSSIDFPSFFPIHVFHPRVRSLRRLDVKIFVMQSAGKISKDSPKYIYALWRLSSLMCWVWSKRGINSWYSGKVEWWRQMKYDDVGKCYSRIVNQKCLIE